MYFYVCQLNLHFKASQVENNAHKSYGSALITFESEDNLFLVKLKVQTPSWIRPLML